MQWITNLGDSQEAHSGLLICEGTLLHLRPAGTKREDAQACGPSTLTARVTARCTQAEVGEPAEGARDGGGQPLGCTLGSCANSGSPSQLSVALTGSPGDLGRNNDGTAISLSLLFFHFSQSQ